MKNAFVSRGKEVVIWGWKPLLLSLVFALAPVLVLIGMSRCPWGNPEQHIRYAGLFLQLFGVVAVIYNIYDKVRRYKRHLKKWFHDYLEQFPNLSMPLSITLSADAKIIQSDSATLAWTIEGDSAIEARVKSLEKRQKNTEALLQEAQSLARDEKQERETHIKKLEERLTKIDVGNLGVDIAGACWLTAGIILSTIPADLASFIPWY